MDVLNRITAARRLLLARTGLAAAAAAVAPTLLASDAQAFRTTPAETAPRYKESEHVKRYYAILGR